MPRAINSRDWYAVVEEIEKSGWNCPIAKSFLCETLSSDPWWRDNKKECWMVIFRSLSKKRLADFSQKLKPAMINAEGEFLLHAAVSCASKSIVQILLRSKPEWIDAVDAQGKSLVHIAAYHERREIIELLFKIKPSLIDVVDYKNKNVLHHNVLGGGIGETAKWLLTLKPELLTAVNSEGRTPLQSAVEFANEKMLKAVCIQSGQSFDYVIDAFINRKYQFIAEAWKLVEEYCSPMLSYLDTDVGMIALEYLVDSTAQFKKKKNAKRLQKIDE